MALRLGEDAELWIQGVQCDNAALDRVIDADFVSLCGATVEVHVRMPPDVLELDPEARDASTPGSVGLINIGNQCFKLRCVTD